MPLQKNSIKFFAVLINLIQVLTLKGLMRKRKSTIVNVPCAAQLATIGHFRPNLKIKLWILLFSSLGKIKKRLFVTLVVETTLPARSRPDENRLGPIHYICIIS